MVRKMVHYEVAGGIPVMAPLAYGVWHNTKRALPLTFSGPVLNQHDMCLFGRLGAIAASGLPLLAVCGGRSRPIV